MQEPEKQTKIDELLQWMRDVRMFSTHDVLKWGSEHFFVRADRAKRELMKAGHIRKLGEHEKEIRGFEGKDAMYEIQFAAAKKVEGRELQNAESQRTLF